MTRSSNNREDLGLAFKTPQEIYDILRSKGMKERDAAKIRRIFELASGYAASGDEDSGAAWAFVEASKAIARMGRN